MITGGYFLRGVFCLIIGIVYLVLAYLFIQYMRQNEWSTKENIDKQLIWGPNKLLIIALILNTLLFAMYVYLTVVYFISWRTPTGISEMAKEGCNREIEPYKEIIAYVTPKFNKAKGAIINT